MRSGGVAVAVERAVRRPGNRALGERRRERRPARRGAFAPAATVSTHSVFGRSVTQGTRQPVRLLLQAARVGDDGLGARDEREHLEIAERLDRLGRSRQWDGVLLEHVTRARVRGEDEASVRAPLTAATIRRSRSGCDVRLAVDRQHGVGRVSSRRALGPAPAIGSEEPRRVGHHVADDLAPAADAFDRELPRRALVRAEEERRRAGRPRSGSAPRASTRSKLRRPASTWATGTSPHAARAPATVEFVSPSTTTQSGRSARDRRGSAPSSPPGRRCAGRAGTRARAGRARRRRPATSPGPSAAPCGGRSRRSPRRAARARGAPT